MKTNTIKSIAALVSAATILSSTVLAGPGPQDHSQPVRSNETKGIANVARTAKAQASDFKSTASTPRPARLVYSPHGGVIVL